MKEEVSKLCKDEPVDEDEIIQSEEDELVFKDAIKDEPI